MSDACIDDEGFAVDARVIRSPNRDGRPPHTQIDLLVIHAISLPPGEFGGSAVEDLFLNRLDTSAHADFAGLRDLKVSAHFFVPRDGTLVQFVSCLERAWHAGVSSWRGRDGCNDFSVGIELEGTDEMPFEAAQYATLARLTRGLRRAYPIADIVGHSDVAPGRKTDPGACFDWDAYHALLK